MFFCDNCAEYGLFCWTAVYLDCPFVSLNPRATLSAEEVQHLLKQVCPGVIVVTEETVASDIEIDAHNELVSVPIKIILSPTDGAPTKGAQGWTQLEHMWSRKRLRFNTSNVKVFENNTIVGFTSGMTSLLKACPQSSENLMISTTAFCLP